MTRRQNLPICISIAMPDSPVTEAYRFLRTAIRTTSTPSGRTLLLASPKSGEGKTSIAANLGVVSAQEGKSVLLIDGNLRKPKLHALFQLPNSIGLSTVLMGKYSLQEAVTPTDVPCLSLLSAGPQPPYPSDLLGSSAMEALLNQCRTDYDLTIIDSPSLLEVSDTEALAHLSDSILIVTRSRYSKKEQLVRARQKLELFHEKIVGVVVNDQREDD